MHQSNSAEIERSGPKRQLLSKKQLRDKGVNYSHPHLYRLIKAKAFPATIKLGENRNAWIEEEVDRWIEEKIAQREVA